jgi:hypothetical protein
MDQFVLVRLQTNNLCMFLCKQMDNDKLPFGTMSKENRPASVFRFPFEIAAYI